MYSAGIRNLGRLVVVILLLVVVPSVVMVRSKTSLGVPAGYEVLESGDILFVDIYHGWSHGGYWDHVAIYSDTPYPGVVEATFNAGVIYTSLPAFLERDRPATVAVRRLKDIPHRDDIIQQTLKYAFAQVGKPFDYIATATLPLKVDEANLHCSEVIWRSFKAAGVDLDSNDGPMVYPDDIYWSPRLGPP